MTKAESLAKASKELMLKEPFYGLLLMSLNKMWSDKLPTAGVRLKGINYELLINPEFWDSLPMEHKIGLLKHELLHIGFFHLVNYESYADKKRLNIAMDYEINQYIERDMLPEGGCFLDNIAHLNPEPTAGTKYYYKLLEDNKDDETVKAMMDGMSDEPGSVQVELPGGGTATLTNHGWDDIEGMDDATKKLIEAQTEHIVKQVADQIAKSRGTVPGEFAEIIERINHIEPPKFDWKGYIRRFAGKSIKTFTKKSRRKFNKRMPGLPGLKIKKQKHILAAVDTSGSVSTNELKEFLHEMYHLKKTGADVTLLQFDSAISSIESFDNKKDTKIHGRGGTDFQPVIDYFNEKAGLYSCLMCFTDGEAPAPEKAAGHILWVISSAGSTSWLEDTYGQLIQLED